MKLEKAIEILENITLVYKVKPWRERAAAIKLGIEALKRLKDWRTGTVLNPDLLLPGETED